MYKTIKKVKMKFNYITKSMIPALVMVLSLSSCLKDDVIDQDFSGVNKDFIGIFDFSPSSSSPNSTSTGIVSTDASSEVNLEVGYIGQGVSSGGDVSVEYDPAVLTELNTLRNTNYVLLSPDDFELPASVNLPAGQKSAPLVVKLKPGKIVKSDDDLFKVFALPIRVTAGPEAISGNYGKHVILISVKNQYDGEYSLSGSIIRNSADGPDPVLGGTYDDDITVDLETLSPTASSFVILWKDGSAAGGVDDASITVDPVTNMVTVKSDVNPDVKNTPGEVNKYDPATRTFTLAFDWGKAPGTRVVKMTLKYEGSR